MTAAAPYRLPLRIRKDGASFIVKDANGLSLAYVYFEDEKSRRDLMNLLTSADAKAVAQAIARALTEAAKAGA